MIEHRPFQSLGKANHGWLNANHHFSFARYHNPDRMGWGALRVWNDDQIAPQSGFPPHPHRDMEIITYVRSGAITHEDHLGNRGRTEAGNVQVMSAGNGIQHSEYNLEDELTEIFQIWIIPSEQGGAPRWASAEFPKGDRSGKLIPLASGRTGDDAGALTIRQDAEILGATLKPGETISYRPAAGRGVYVVSARGAVEVNGVLLTARDGAAIKDEDTIVFSVPQASSDAAEFLLADVPLN